MAFALCLIALMAGCGREFAITADTLVSPNHSFELAEHYYVIPADSSVNSSDLQFKENLSLLEPYLKEKNIIITPNLIFADNIMTLGYGISEPITKQDIITFLSEE